MAEVILEVLVDGFDLEQAATRISWLLGKEKCEACVERDIYFVELVYDAAADSFLDEKLESLKDLCPTESVLKLCFGERFNEILKFSNLPVFSRPSIVEGLFLSLVCQEECRFVEPHFMAMGGRRL